MGAEQISEYTPGFNPIQSESVEPAINNSSVKEIR